MRYWITHPNLTPEHDHEIEALALPDWSRSGWRIRDDQTARVDLTPAAPRPTAADDTAPTAAAVDGGQTPDDDVAPDPSKRTGRKGA